jgi:acetylglutamate kinase
LKQVGIHPVVVHGGGPQIGRMLDRLKIRSEFIDGLRVTDAETVEIVEMVLSGSINKEIVAAISAAGGTAVGLSGKDGQLIMAQKLTRSRRGGEASPDLGYVGEPTEVNVGMLTRLEQAGMIPVIAPIGAGSDGATFNINADTVAGIVAAAAKATRLLLLTDVTGVLDKAGNLIAELTVSRARELIADGTISGGMIPKIETCISAIEGGLEAAVIIDGRVPHALLLEIFTTHGVGTLIRG